MLPHFGEENSSGLKEEKQDCHEYSEKYLQ